MLNSSIITSTLAYLFSGRSSLACRSLLPIVSLILAAVILHNPAIAASEDPSNSAISLDKELPSILNRQYAGKDSAALLQAVMTRTQWGEGEEDLIAAQAILLYDRGDWQLAFPLLRKLKKPSNITLELLADCMERKGERYEAATYHLTLARRLNDSDAAKIDHLKGYLNVMPDKIAIRLELARVLAGQGRKSEAANTYLQQEAAWIRDVKMVLQVSDWLDSENRLSEMSDLFQRALEIQPGQLVLFSKQALLEERLGHKNNAAQIWLALAAKSPKETDALNRGLALLEGSGDKAALRQALQTATQSDSLNFPLRYKLATTCLELGDKECAYRHANALLPRDANNIVVQNLLRESITNDEQVRQHFALIKNGAERPGLSANRLALVARGYNLNNNANEACRYWLRLKSLDAQVFANHPEAISDLAVCKDAHASAAVAEMTEKGLPSKLTHEALKSIVITSFKLGNLDRASDALLQLLGQAPAERLFAEQQIQQWVAAGHHAPALKVLRKMVKSETSPSLAYLMGVSLQKTGSCKDAITFFRESKEKLPQAIMPLAQCQVQNGDTASAVKELRAYTNTTKDLEGLRLLASLGKGNLSGAEHLQLMSNLVAQGKASSADRIRYGLLLHAAGETEKAIGQLQTILKSPPTSEVQDLSQQEAAGAALVLGQYYASIRTYDRAIGYLVDGLKVNREDFAAWKSLGEAYAARGRHAEALKSLEVAASNSPGSQDISLQRARLTAAKKSHNDAAEKRALSDIARLDPTDLEAQKQAGKRAFADKDYALAVEYFTRLTTQNPKSGEAWGLLGNTLALLPDIALATEPLQKALDQGYQTDAVYINRARAYRQSGDRSMAESILSFLLGRNPKNYLALVWSAKFAQLDGDVKLAEDLYRRAASVGPVPDELADLARLGMASE